MREAAYLFPRMVSSARSFDSPSSLIQSRRRPYSTKGCARETRRGRNGRVASDRLSSLSLSTVQISYPIVGIRVALYPHELMLRAGELTTHAVTTIVDLRDNEFYKPTPCYKRKIDAQFGHFRPRNYRPERQFMRGQTEMGTRRSAGKKNGTESNRIAEERALVCHSFNEGPGRECIHA
jgi:hypothetical protein